MCSEPAVAPASGATEPARWPIVLPFAAALWSLVARAVPLDVPYRPNTLGIVSLATLQRYPVQQEAIWYALSIGAVGLLALGLGAALRTAERRSAGRPGHPYAGAAAQALAAAAVAAVVFLRPALALPAVALALAGALALSTRARVEAPPTREAARGPGPLGLRAAAGLAFAAIAVLLTPPLPDAVRHVAAATPDAALVTESWSFHAELGQHLVWADAMRRGELPGRDFFTLYGPLYPGGLLATWAIFGRSLASAWLWDALMNASGTFIVLALAAACLRRRGLVLAIPFLVSFSNLRVALPLLALLALLRWQRRGGVVAPALAGAGIGASLLFSPEFGVAALVASAGCLVAAGAWRAAIAAGAGTLAVLAPVFAAFAVLGALAPFTRDLVGYSSWMLAGFGKIPFPSPLAELPLDPAAARTPRALVLRLGLGAGAVFAAAAWSALPEETLARGRLRALPRALRDRLAASPACLAALWLGLFGLVGFRSVLGRSDLTHAAGVLPVSALLLVLAADRALAAERGRGAALLAATRVAALAALAVAAGFTTIAAPLRTAGATLQALGRPVAPLARSEADARVWQVAERIRALTPEGAAIYVLPNSAAYPYLAERRLPTRFALAHQMVTNAHRAEALRALAADPPALVVWDDAGVRVDGIPDEKVLGPRLAAWLDAHYALAERVGPVRLLRPRGAGPATP